MTYPPSSGTIQVAAVTRIAPNHKAGISASSTRTRTRLTQPSSERMTAGGGSGGRGVGDASRSYVGAIFTFPRNVSLANAHSDPWSDEGSARSSSRPGGEDRRDRRPFNETRPGASRCCRRGRRDAAAGCSSAGGGGGDRLIAGDRVPDEGRGAA